VFNQSNNSSGIVADLLTTSVDRQIFTTVAAAIFTGILALVARNRLGRAFRRPNTPTASGTEATPTTDDPGEPSMPGPR
jgi:hypothetical protein